MHIYVLCGTLYIHVLCIWMYKCYWHIYVVIMLMAVQSLLLFPDKTLAWTPVHARDNEWQGTTRRAIPGWRLKGTHTKMGAYLGPSHLRPPVRMHTSR